jgi:hypothetical protein
VFSCCKARIDPHIGHSPPPDTSLSGGNEAIDLWKAYRDGLCQSAARDTVEVLKPLPVDNASGSAGSGQPSAEIDYPIGAVNQVYMKRTNTEKQASVMIVKFLREVVSEGRNGNRQGTRKVATDAADFGGLVTELHDDFAVAI